MQGVSGSNPLGSIQRINQSLTGFSAAFKGRLFSAYMAKYHFCAPKSAPNCGKWLCWHKKSKHSLQWDAIVFTLQVTFGHSLSTTTGRYVADNPWDSCSLRLGECIELLTATLY